MMAPVGIILLACCMMIGFNQIILVFAGFRALNTMGIEKGMLIREQPEPHRLFHTFQYRRDFHNRQSSEYDDADDDDKKYTTTTVRIPVRQVLRGDPHIFRHQMAPIREEARTLRIQHDIMRRFGRR